MSSTLSVERIMASRDFSDEGFDRPRWWNEGSFYTTLRSRSVPSAGSLGGLTETTASAGASSNMTVNEIILHNAESGESSVLVSYEDLIPRGQGNPIAIHDYSTSNDRTKVLIFTNSQKVWRYNTKGSYWLLDLSAKGTPNFLWQLGGDENDCLLFASFSPDASKVAYVRKNNIFVEDLATRASTALTTDGSEMIINGMFDWVYEEEFQMQNGFRWSPDGSHIAYWQIDQTGVSVVNLVNNTDSLYPRLVPIPYPKCGQTNPSARIGVVSVDALSQTWIQTPGDSRDNYIADLDFIPATGELIIQQLNRLQNNLTVMIGDPSSGSVNVIYTDRDTAWVDIKHSLPWSKSGAFFITLSERDGWRRAYKVVKNPSSEAEAVVPLTPFGYDAIEMVGCDDENQLLYYIASPTDPLRRYLYVVGYDGTQNRRVTPDTVDYLGTNGYTLSKDCRFAVHTFSNVNRPTITSIVALPSHDTVLTLATNSNLLNTFSAVNLAPIQFFKVPISIEGEAVELDAWILHPPDFDASKAASYPVIFYVYGEPAAQIVKDQWGARLSLWHRMLTHRGCVVVSVDNRGTPCPKGREWRKCIYGQVGILASKDQAAAVNQILESRPYLDQNRVGVWGWSGGGSMSLNCLFRYPHLYQNAVVVAPVPDMQLYDTIYQERYMGLPLDNPDGYKNGSPITFANQMNPDANLLLIHGTGDDNCHYQGMERLINELVKHNKQFQMLAYPNRSHSISEGPNTTRHLFEAITRFWKSCGLII